MADHYEPIVPDGTYLSESRTKEGAVKGMLFDKTTKQFVANADWVPVDFTKKQADPSPRPVTASAPKQLSPAERELLQQLVEIGVYLTGEGVKWAAPHVKNWFVGKALPAMKTTIKKLREKEVALAPEETKLTRIVITDETVVISTPGSDIAEVEPVIAMTSDEFLQRFAALRAARAFEDEQWRILSAARIDDGENAIEASDATGELAPHQFAELVQSILRTNPSLFEDGSVEELIRVLRSRPDDEGDLALKA